MEGLPFSIGERLDFKIYFEFIRGGDASMSVKNIENIDGSPCYHIVSEARSTRTVDMFYKVRDRIECWRDVAGGHTRRYVKKLREGRYRDEKRVEYKPENGEALLFRGSSQTPETLSVPGYVQDALSAFYEVRTRELKVGESVWIDLHDIRKRYNLEVKVLRQEKVKVPAGKFDCLVIEPMLQSSGIFRREGKIQIWVTNDRHRMPVLMKSKLYFGRVWARLVGYRRGSE